MLEKVEGFTELFITTDKEIFMGKDAEEDALEHERKSLEGQAIETFVNKAMEYLELEDIKLSIYQLASDQQKLRKDASSEKQAEYKSIVAKAGAYTKGLKGKRTKFNEVLSETMDENIYGWEAAEHFLEGFFRLVTSFKDFDELYELARNVNDTTKSKEISVYRSHMSKYDHMFHDNKKLL